MPVRKFQGSGRRIGGFGALESGIHYRTVMDVMPVWLISISILRTSS